MFGIDFSETFAPVARLDTIRMLLSLAVQRNWKIYQLDVKSAFLNGYLEKEILSNNQKVLLSKEKKKKYTFLRRPCMG